MRLSLGIPQAGVSPMGRAPLPRASPGNQRRAITTTSVRMLPENSLLVGLRPDSDSGAPNCPYTAPDSRMRFPKIVRAC